MLQADVKWYQRFKLWWGVMSMPDPQAELSPERGLLHDEQPHCTDTKTVSTYGIRRPSAKLPGD